MQVVNNKVNLKLVRLDGNAFSLLGAFFRQAKKENCASEEIGKVRAEAATGDYDHLLVTLLSHCK